MRKDGLEPQASTAYFLGVSREQRNTLNRGNGKPSYYFGTRLALLAREPLLLFRVYGVWGSFQEESRTLCGSVSRLEPLLQGLASNVAIIACPCLEILPSECRDGIPKLIHEILGDPSPPYSIQLYKGD